MATRFRAGDLTRNKKERFAVDSAGKKFVGRAFVVCLYLCPGVVPFELAELRERALKHLVLLSAVTRGEGTHGYR